MTKCKTKTASKKRYWPLEPTPLHSRKLTIRHRYSKRSGRLVMVMTIICPQNFNYTEFDGYRTRLYYRELCERGHRSAGQIASSRICGNWWQWLFTIRWKGFYSLTCCWCSCQRSFSCDLAAVNSQPCKTLSCGLCQQCKMGKNCMQKRKKKRQSPYWSLP